MFTEYAAAIWGWLQPGLSAAWEWLSGWITDPQKRQQLWDGITTGWNVFTEWAAAVWGWLQPGLAAAWGWLSSWITDPAKRQQLWDGIVGVWNVFTDWASAVWGWLQPGLSAAWGWLSGWITDPQKRQQLWDGIVAAWNVFTEWAANIWAWLQPGLAAAWQALTGWITDPQKREELTTGASEWGKKLIYWANYLWTGGENFEGLQKKLDRWFGSFRKWLDENLPRTSESLGKLVDTFKELFAALDQLFSYENEQGIKVTWRTLWIDLNGNSADQIDQIVANITDLVNRITLLFSGLANIALGFKNNEWGPIWKGMEQISRAAMEQIKVDAQDMAKFLPETLDMTLMRKMGYTQMTWADLWEKIGIAPGKAKEKIKSDLDAHSPSREFEKISNSIIDAFAGFEQRWNKIFLAMVVPRPPLPDMRGDADRVAFDTMAGLVNGINSRMKWLTDVGGDLARAVLDPIKRALGIASPSKVFRELGRYVTEGFALGIDDLIQLPALNVERMVRHTIEATPAAAGAMTGSTSRLDVYLHAGEGTLPTNRAQLQELMRMLQRELTLAGGRAAY